MSMSYTFKLGLILSLGFVLAGCDNRALMARNEMINRCNGQTTISAGTRLDQRQTTFTRKEHAASGCSPYAAINHDLRTESFSVYGFPAGFYPQGEPFRTDMLISKNSYEQNFKNNYADYQATLDSAIPDKCLGNSFHGCVRRLAETLTVTTDITGSYISTPGCAGGICNTFSSASVTVRPPRSTNRTVDNQITLSLLSKSAAKKVGKIALTFNAYQSARMVAAPSAQELRSSNLYEVFSALNDQCSAMGPDRFYDGLATLLSGKQKSKNHLHADGFSATAASMWSSNRPIRLCGMTVTTGGYAAATVDWDSAMRSGSVYLNITP